MFSLIYSPFFYFNLFSEVIIQNKFPLETKIHFQFIDTFVLYSFTYSLVINFQFHIIQQPILLFSTFILFNGFFVIFVVSWILENVYLVFGILSGYKVYVLWVCMYVCVKRRQFSIKKFNRILYILNSVLNDLEGMMGIYWLK